MRALRFQWREVTVVAPVEIRTEIGCRVDTGLTLVSGKVSSDCQPQDLVVKWADYVDEFGSVHLSRKRAKQLDRERGMTGC